MRFSFTPPFKAFLAFIAIVLLAAILAPPAEAQIISLYQEFEDGSAEYLGEADVNIEDSLSEELPGIEDMSCDLYMRDSDGDGRPDGDMSLVCYGAEYDAHEITVEAGYDADVE